MGQYYGTYVFTTPYKKADGSSCRFIINDERSSLGYGYPRIFIEKTNGGYINFDSSLGGCFSQRASEFNSWLDGTETNIGEDWTITDVNRIAETVGFKPGCGEAILNMVKEIMREE